jgi:hypothetical protein
VGRRNLILKAAVLVAAFGLTAQAAGELTWRVVADGPAPGVPVTKPTGYVALTRAATASFAARLGKGAAALAQVDFARSALVAVFGEFGCEDELIDVSSIVQRGTVLAVRLTQNAPPPGTAECLALYGTYRLLTVPRASLGRPYPTRVSVLLART